MKGQTFRTLYCQRAGIDEGQFSRHLLARALYQHSRPVAWLIARLDHQHFQADYEFIEDIGHLTHLGGFSDAAQSCCWSNSMSWMPKYFISPPQRAISAAQRP